MYRQADIQKKTWTDIQIGNRSANTEDIHADADTQTEQTHENTKNVQIFRFHGYLSKIMVYSLFGEIRALFAIFMAIVNLFNKCSLIFFNAHKTGRKK
jgi:hypothetical protein